MKIDDNPDAVGETSAEVTSFLNCVAENIAHVFFDEDEIRYYTVTTAEAGDTDTYTSVVFPHRPVQMLNAVATKTSALDIDISQNVTATETTAQEAGDFGFAFHGNRYLVDDDGEERIFITKMADRTGSNMTPDLSLKLKHLLYSLAIGDAESILNGIRGVSGEIDNRPMENVNTKPKVKRRKLTLTPLEL